jgi:hypothetical protein
MPAAHELDEARPANYDNYSICVHLDKCVIIDLRWQLSCLSMYDSHDHWNDYFLYYDYFGYGQPHPAR